MPSRKASHPAWHHRASADPSSEDGPSAPARPPGGGSRPTPTGRRTTSIPVVEIGARRVQGAGARGPGTLEGATSGGRAAPGARGHPRGRDARPLHGVVPDPGQSYPRAGRGSPRAGTAGARLRPLGRRGMARWVRSARSGHPGSKASPPRTEPVRAPADRSRAVTREREAPLLLGSDLLQPEMATTQEQAQEDDRVVDQEPDRGRRVLLEVE